MASTIIKVLDVLLNSGQKNRLGGPAMLTGSAQYEMNTFRYPEDIGNYDKGHYILLHINEQTKTQFRNPQSSDKPTVIANMEKLQAMRGSTNAGSAVPLVADLARTVASNDTVNAIIGEVDATVKNVAAAADNLIGPNSSVVQDTVGGIGTSVSSAFSSLNDINGTSFLRTIRRTTDTIALYMPDSLQFNYSQSYNTPALSDGLLAMGTAAGVSAVEAGKAGASADQIGKNLSPFILNFISKSSMFGSLGKALFTAGTGLVQNPMMEVIYSSPRLRSFNFTFVFYPRSESESMQVQKIIDRLRYHQAPEIEKNSGGYFLRPPSEFDIKFMYNGLENPNIDRISTCVLENISVDYTKNGQWVAYEVEGENNPSLGRTGMPVAIGLSLQFRETQIFTKEYYRQS